MSSSGFSTDQIEQLIKQVDQLYLDSGPVQMNGSPNDPLFALKQSIDGLVNRIETRRRKNFSEQQYFLRRVLDGMPLEVVIFDRDLRYQYVNPRGIRDPEIREWIIGKTNFEYCEYRGVDPEIGRNRDAALFRALEKRETLTLEEVSYRRGSPQHYLRVITPLYDEKGELDLLVGYGVEVTALKLKEEELTQKNEALTKTNRELDQFVYRASHDLRSPLVSIMGILNLMDDYEQNELNAKFLEMIKVSVTKLDSFISEIVNYTRNARTDLEFNQVDLETMAGGIIENLQFLDGSGEMEFQIELDQEVPWYTDPFRMEFILNNLISNAIKYRNKLIPDPKAIVRLHTTAEVAVLEVEDNGIGIAPEYIDEVFSMFFRASNQSFGSGIGLYIVREAIDLLGGKVEIDSVEGLGSTFRVTLPNSAVPSA